MTIAVVSTFVKPPIQEMSVGSAGTPATEHMNSGLDFASMLLGQPFVAAKPLPDDDQPDNSELAIADAGTAATATDPQFLATLGFPPAQQPGSSVLATNPEIDPSRSVRTEALLPSTPTRIAPETPEIRAQTGDERQPAASTPLASDDKPAKFAVAEFAVPSAVPSAEPSGWNTPELRNPASGPGTLAAWPSPKRSGSNQPEPPFAPASGPGTLAAWPSPERSGSNEPEPPFAPASGPGTLTAWPSSERSGSNQPEPPFAPASGPGTLTAWPSPERSGSNQPEPPFAPASSPGTLTAWPSSERSGSNQPEPLFAPASGPGTLTAWPSSERSGSNQPEPPFAPASGPGTLTAWPSPERSGSSQPEPPFAPASSPGTLTAWPSPERSGSNQPEPPFAPASSPDTLAAWPSSERSGSSQPEPPFAPASGPGTLAAWSSSERSGSNQPEPPFAPASSPDTLAAWPSSERSGSSQPEPPFAPASSPGTLATWPSPERSGSNPPEPPFAPASSPSTLASLPGNFVSGAALTHDIPHHLQTPLHDPSWASDLGQKLLWFASNEKQLAQLTLHPPQLGSIEITLNLDKDGASAHFVSLNADVRGAIETAVPRLREMFAGTGIALGQVSVGSESFRQQSDGQPEPQHRPRPLADNAILGSDSVNVLSGKTFVTQRGRGLIDIFA